MWIIWIYPDCETFYIFFSKPNFLTRWLFCTWFIICIRQTPSCLRNLVESLPDPQVEIPKVLVWIMCCWLHIACVRALMKIKHWEINRKRKFIIPIVCWLNKISIKAHSFLINDGQALMLHNAQGIK